MSREAEFSTFSRQSKKGILIIYTNLLWRVLKSSWFLIFFIIKDFSKIKSTHFYYGVGAVFLILLFCLVKAILDYKNFLFKVENNYFILKQGIIKKSNTSVSFDRIQNINFKQNIIQQIINVFQVEIETAGSNKTEIAIKALSFKGAQLLKKQLTTQKNIEESKEERVEEKSKKPFLKINFTELLKVSLTENHLRSLFLFLALIIGLYFQINDVLKSLNKEKTLDYVLDNSTNSIIQNSLLLIIFLVLLILVSFLVSFIRVLLVHFELKVFIKNKSFNIQQGLLNKRSILLKNEKIQSITISTNPIKKKLNLSYVTFMQAVSGNVSRKNSKLIKIVGCKNFQIDKIKNILFKNKDLEFSEKQQSDPFYKRRLTFKSFLLIVIINLTLYLFFWNLKLFFLNIILIPITFFWIKVIYRKRFYKISDNILQVGSGFLETHLTFLPFFKIQNIKMKQTFFQKKYQVVDIVFQTASGKVVIPCVNERTAIQIYNYTLFKVEVNVKLWM